MSARRVRCLGTALILSAACAHAPGGGAPATAPPGPAPAKGRPEFSEYAPAEVAAAATPHAYHGKPLCQGCHDASGAVRGGDPVALCRGCHTHGHSNHPVDVVQKVSPGNDIPLLAGGRVACHTCHDPHKGPPDRGRLRMDADAMCVRCHKGH